MLIGRDMRIAARVRRANCLQRWPQFADEFTIRSRQAQLPERDARRWQKLAAFDEDSRSPDDLAVLRLEDFIELVGLLRASGVWR